MPEKKESKRFDKIIKENREAFFAPFIKKVLGIEIVEAVPLAEKLQTTLEREIDFVRKVKDKNSEEYILHLEFQTKEESDMVYRMAEYRAILQRKYKLPVRQYVIFLGEGVAKMRNTLKKEEEITGFELCSLSEVDYSELLASSIPQEVLFAILCNFQSEDPGIVVSHILNRLKEISPDKASLRKFITQLNIFSQLRKLEKVVYNQAFEMPIEIDITQNYVYKLAAKKGLDQGLAKGLEQGLDLGIERTKIQTVKNALNSRAFLNGAISYEDIAEISGLSVDQVKEIHIEIEKGREDSEA
ncbi:MAG: hypothetical protein AAGA10_19115 [Bacteroidota bacterium]